MTEEKDPMPPTEYRTVDIDGHFAAEMRVAFRSLRKVERGNGEYDVCPLSHTTGGDGIMPPGGEAPRKGTSLSRRI